MSARIPVTIDDIAFSSLEAAEVIETLDAVNVRFSTLSLMIAAIAEYHAACTERGTLPGSAVEFAEQVSQLAEALSVVHYAKVSDLQSQTPTLSELPDGMFLSPGPVDPQ